MPNVLRRNGKDVNLAGEDSYFEGSSVNNQVNKLLYSSDLAECSLISFDNTPILLQPIESFWRHYREEGFQFWIDHFKVCYYSTLWPVLWITPGYA